METQDQHNNSFENSSSIPKQNNFKIPEGYFEKLASHLEGELDVKNESPKKGVLRVLVINISIAAAVVLGVFLFNPQRSESINEFTDLGEVSDEEAIYVEDYMLAMVESTEEWQPLVQFDIEMMEVSEEEIESIEMPVVEDITADDITDFFEDEDYYEL